MVRHGRSIMVPTPANNTTTWHPHYSWKVDKKMNLSFLSVAEVSGFQKGQLRKNAPMSLECLYFHLVIYCGSVWGVKWSTRRVNEERHKKKELQYLYRT